MRELERVLMLRVVDTLWMDHLDEMEHVKREIGLRAVSYTHLVFTLIYNPTKKQASLSLYGLPVHFFL